MRKEGEMAEKKKRMRNEGREEGGLKMWWGVGSMKRGREKGERERREETSKKEHSSSYIFLFDT